MTEANKTSPAFTSNSSNSGYFKNGISISPVVPAAGEKLKIQYNGLLAQRGATHIYAHVGYGDTWDNTYDFPMYKTDEGFEVNIPVIKSGELNICFKDCANNWDNNSGNNYLINVVQ